MTARRCIVGLLAALTLGAIAAPVAMADPTAEVGIEDNNVLFKDPNPGPTIAKWKALGVDNVRVLAIWGHIAPKPNSRTRPAGFNPSVNTSPLYNWAPLDKAIGLIRANGLTVSLTFLNFGPLWASEKPSMGDPTYKPKPAEFAAFASAAARRYKGKIKRYLAGNEPNQRAFLKPQYECKGRVCQPAAATRYRQMVLAAYPAIKRADPGVPVLIGELAPIGGKVPTNVSSSQPMPFLRDFACVDAKFKPVTTGLCKNFKAASGDGLGYHPYQVKAPPTARQSDPNLVKLGDLDRLFSALDKLTAQRRLKARGISGAKMDVYLTEFGYETNPPDKFNGVNPPLQATWLQQAAYIAWATPRVKSIAQYVWQDEPLSRAPNGRLVVGFQTGLLFVNGSPKPSLNIFPHPIFADRQPKAPIKPRVWGQVRPGGVHVVTLQVSAPGTTTFTNVSTRTTDSRGYWTVTRKIVKGERYRITYPADDGVSSIITAPVNVG